MTNIDSMTYWTNKLASKAPSTRERYMGFFEQFCKFTKKTPEELLDQRLSDLKAEDHRERKGIECLLLAWMVKLRDEKYSLATSQIAFASVKSFFASNEYSLNITKNEIPKPDQSENYQVSEGSRVITKEMIKQILESKELTRNKLQVHALILFLKDTGLRVSDVRKLNYGLVAEGLEKNLEFIPLIVRTQKAGTIAFTFMGTESISAIKAYLEERRKGTRHLPPEVLTEKSPLFRTHEGVAVKRMTRSGLSNTVIFHCQRTLKNEKNLSAHSFRKFLQTNLESSGVPANWIDKILGHELRGSTGAYSKPEDFTEKEKNLLFEAYKKAYPVLRVYPERVETEIRISTLEIQLADKNREIIELKTNGHQKASELETLQARVKNLEGIEAHNQSMEELEAENARLNETLTKRLVIIEDFMKSQGIKGVELGGKDQTPKQWKQSKQAKKKPEAK